ncbi:MAG: hypothetical protein ACTSPI_18090 [Candidatus Heimdallarchaeaceae archaeon]
MHTLSIRCLKAKSPVGEIGIRRRKKWLQKEQENGQILMLILVKVVLMIVDIAMLEEWVQDLDGKLAGKKCKIEKKWQRKDLLKEKELL